MYIPINEPAEQIAPQARHMWQLTQTIGHLAAGILFLALLLSTQVFHWYTWIETVSYVLLGLTMLSAVFSIFIEPSLQQRYWRYSADSRYVQLKHGRWIVTATIIPVEKIEYVRLEQGPFLRKYGLCNLVLGTSTTPHTIPALLEKTAKELKSKIAQYANIPANDGEGANDG